ncbi:hypothetical protein [Sandarakinorhabdus sp. DWP1-3-1]|uniref:hypothetical protein n=1 Tax=Sandarakinorhabdus sp. DWP1-3-1 TaxID=2804627 RepID=UPI003CF49C54
MVQIIENHAEISGTIIGSAPDPALPGFVVLTIRVDDAHDVGNSPNLFCHDIGQTISVHARNDSAAATAESANVRLRVKKVGPGRSFAEE